MDKEFLENLLKGESLPGQLIWECEGKRHVVPGMILVETSGQAVVQLILDEFSPVSKALEPSFVVTTGDREVPSVSVPATCFLV